MEYVKNFFIVVGLFILSQLSMFGYGIAKEISTSMGHEHLSLGVSILLILLVIGNIWLLLFLAKKLGFLAFKFNFFTKKNLGIIIGGFLLGRVIAVGGTLLLNNQGTSSTANDAALQTIFTGENPLLIFLLIGVAAPIMEEIVFRGGIIGLWLVKFPIVGIIISSLVFGMLHGPTDFISFLMYVLIGLILSLAYYKTKRLEVSISIHFLNNFLGAIAIGFGLI